MHMQISARDFEDSGKIQSQTQCHEYYLIGVKVVRYNTNATHTMNIISPVFVYIRVSDSAYLLGVPAKYSCTLLFHRRNLTYFIGSDIGQVSITHINCS